MGKEYSTSYAKLTNIILQMSNYHRSKLFDIAEYMQRDPMRRIYYGSKRKKSSRLIDLFIGFLLGFICGVVFIVSISTIFEFLKSIIHSAY